jgi:4-amino-4-deoxy-L-arabinose transferase-like glycosyltransferase
VQALLKLIQRESVWPLQVFLLAALVLLPGIWSFGMWEPHEIRIADEARQSLDADDVTEDGKKPGKAAKKKNGPDLTEDAIAWGISNFGQSELGARLPLTLLGLIAVMAIFFLGLRLGSPRAGVFAAVVFMTFPLIVFQSRQLMSDIGAVTGSSLMMLGLVGLAWPHRGRAHTRLWGYPIDVALVAVGATLAYFSAALFLGVFVPLAAVAVASIAGIFAIHGDESRSTEARWGRAHLATVGALCVIAALVCFAVVFYHVYDWRDPVPGTRQIFGQSFIPTEQYIETLGGKWRLRDDLSSNFDSLFEQIAYGAFPWSVLAPIAIAHLMMGPRTGRSTWAGYVVVAWAVIGWVVATVMIRKVGPVLYPALGAMALAIGIWLDRLLASRKRADDGSSASSEGLPVRMPLIALALLLGAFVLAKDMQAFPDKITSIHLVDSTVKYPKGTSIKAGLLLFGALFGISMFVGLWLWRRKSENGEGLRRVTFVAGRHGIHAGLAAGVMFAVFLAQVWTPALSRKLSSKHLFSVFRNLKSSGDVLGVMGNTGSGPKYYAGGNYEKLSNRSELIDFLKRDERVFALAPASELCPVHRSAKEGFDYYVLDDSHARFLLMSNVLKDDKGEKDKNPLARAILREEPKDIKTRVSANFDNKIELIGVDMPRKVGRGDSFTMKLYFKVLKPIGGSWKMFVHFDGGGLRFQGDHDPINGRCGTTFWQKGDYIVDTFQVEAGDMTYSKTDYRAWIGFFYGSGGNWKNMPVVSKDHDDNNRVPVGVVSVR